MTLLFAGHDTTTSTVAFMFYELAKAPHLAEQLRAEQAALLKDGTPNATQLMSGELASGSDDDHGRDSVLLGVFPMSPRGLDVAAIRRKTSPTPDLTECQEV